MSDLLIKNVNLDYARKHGGLNLHLYVGKEDAMEVTMNDAFADDCLGFCKVKELPPHEKLVSLADVMNILERSIEIDDADLEYIKENLKYIHIIEA